MSIKQSLMAFNRGLVSNLGLARMDVKRIALSAETMTNWMPRVLGSMGIRVGWKYLGSTKSDAATKMLPFVFATDDTALLELTNIAMRIWVDDALVTRPTVTAAVTNGSFPANIASWTDSSEAGGTLSWHASGYMQLVGDGTDAAIADQQVTVNEAGTEHALRITIARGPVTLLVGSASATDDYISTTVLQEGEHSLAFTPTGNFHIRFLSRQIPQVYVDSCEVEAAGVVSLLTPWLTADLGDVRRDQSADVVFVACDGHQQRRIERRAARSWSVVKYWGDGPYLSPNVSKTTLTPSVKTGNGTMTASSPIFKSTDVGRGIQFTSTGQSETIDISAQNTFGDPIKLTGAGSDRAFTVNLSGLTGTGNTVWLQASWDNITWFDSISYTADDVLPYEDAYTNEVIYYRLGIKTGGYAGGTTTCLITAPIGDVIGVVRIVGFTSSLVVDMEVITELGNITASEIWALGAWSDTTGWPTAVALYEGRLWWSGKTGVWGSISDAYDGFDPEFPGDAGTIHRTIGSGPVDKINWILALQGMAIGAQGSELSARSSVLGEVLTPTTFNLKPATNQGSGAVDPVVIDAAGIFVNRSGIKVFELNANEVAGGFVAKDMTSIVPDLGKPGIVRMVCHRQPDTRIHCIRSDGTAMLLVTDKNEDVMAWIEIETDGLIEDVVTLPALSGNTDDQVYYVVQRTINSVTKRYLEKWAQNSECLGDANLCMLADSYFEYTGAPITAVTGLGHLEGESVVVWADGKDVGTDDSARPWTQKHTVVAGALSPVLSVAASNIVIGLPYTAQFKSVKLGEATQAISSPLNQAKAINHIGLIMANVHPKGIKHGPAFGDDVMDDMPEIEGGVVIDQDTMRATYDEQEIEFNGETTTDARVCLQGQAPRPVTVLAATMDLEMEE